jgi:hypothetical protein
MNIIFILMMAYADSTARPCFHYGFSEKLALDPRTLFAGAQVTRRVGTYEGYFLSNTSARSLILKLDNGKYLKLSGGNVYEGDRNALSTQEWRLETSDVRIQGDTRITNYVKGRKIPDTSLYGSNDSPPAKPEDVNFEIPAVLDGKALTIRGRLIYEPVTNDCRR